MSGTMLLDQLKTTEQKKAKEWTIAKVIYVGLMSFNLFSFIWLLATGSELQNIPSIVWITRLTAGLFATCLGRLWRNRGFQILGTYTLLFMIRSLYSNLNALFTTDISASFLSAIWLFAGCYGLGSILNKEQLKKYLFIHSCIWIACMVVFSCIGIWAGWTDQIFYTLGDGYFGFYYGNGRLLIVYLASISGSFLGITSILCLICLLCVKNKPGKICFSVSLIILFFTLALTGARTSFISTAIGFGLIAYLKIQFICESRRVQQKSKQQAKKRVCSISVFVIVTIVTLFFLTQMTTFFFRLKTLGILPKALAENVEPVLDLNRSFTDIMTLNGRTEVWQSILEYFRDHPIILLTGQSKINPLDAIIPGYAHSHSIYLQILVESGIPGLSLLLLFIIYTFIHGFHFAKSIEEPLWVRFLVLIPICLWIGDATEAFLWLRSSQCPMNAILLIAAGVICSEKHVKRSSNSLCIE